MIYFFQTRPCLPTWSVVCTIFPRSSQRVRSQHIGLQERSLYCSDCCTGQSGEPSVSVLIYTSTFIFYFHWLIKLIGCMIESHSADFIPLWVFSKNLLITSYCIVDLELYIYIYSSFIKAFEVPCCSL